MLRHRRLVTLLAAIAMVVVAGIELEAGQKRPDNSKAKAKAAAAATAKAKANAKANAAHAIGALPLQVALDRAHFPVGGDDGHVGGKTLKALHAFQQTHGLSVSDAPDQATWTALASPHLQAQATVTYTITPEDAAGPFVERIPNDPADQGKLEALGYRSLTEMLAERFHESPALLHLLNPRTPIAAGRTITVPNVDPLVPPQGSGRRREADMNGNGAAQAAEVVVAKDTNDLVAPDANGAVIFYAPVSSGSEHDPLPIGDWTVRGVYLNPRFFYNPELFWDADPSHTRTRIAPGPNNPVGFIWIDLDRPHYGLHGTPEPAMVGVTQSHGCVRLTNWDAVTLAAMVREGTRVSFRPTLPEPSEHTASLHKISTGSTDKTDQADEFDHLMRELRERHLLVPVSGVRVDQLVESFTQARGGHAHEALDILAPRGTPVLAVDDGSIARLFLSKPGGNTIYQFDPSGRFAYYYAHLDRYAEGLKEGQRVRRGDTIGYVGSTGNADPRSPHLHFGIFVLTTAKQWWKGTAIEPYPVFRAPEGKQSVRRQSSLRLRSASAGRSGGPARQPPGGAGAGPARPARRHLPMRSARPRAPESRPPPARPSPASRPRQPDQTTRQSRASTRGPRTAG